MSVEQREDAVVRALVRFADRCGDVEHAAARPPERREDDDEADRLVRDHGLSADRVIAFRGLARSRGVGLEEVLRHWLRGELRAVVERPPVYKRPDDEPQD